MNELRQKLITIRAKQLAAKGSYNPGTIKRLANEALDGAFDLIDSLITEVEKLKETSHG